MNKNCYNCIYSGDGEYGLCLREEPKIVAYNLEKISTSENVKLFSALFTAMRRLPVSIHAPARGAT